MTHISNQIGCGIVRESKRQAVDFIAGSLRESSAGQCGRAKLSHCNHCGFPRRFCGIVRVSVPLLSPLGKYPAGLLEVGPAGLGVM